MEVRDPIMIEEFQYMKNVKERTFTPKLFWQRCECCGKEYRKIPMFRITKQYFYLSGYHVYNGCSNCFFDIDDFREYLEAKGNLMSHEDFQFLQNMEERLRKNDPTITEEERNRMAHFYLT